MPTPDELTAGYQQAVRLLRARINQLAVNSWDSLGSYRDADIDRLIAALVPRVQAGQLLVARLTASYMLQVMAAEGIAAAPAPVDEEAILSARGVPAEEVYRRPANQLYTALADGKTFAEAVATGRARLLSLTSTDLQMAKVRQSNASLGRSDTRYYRRVLKGTENCAKCIITSTRRYRVGRLLPIHPGCIPAGSSVSVPSGHGGHGGSFAWGEVQAVTRRMHQGELIEIVTASGDLVSVTPNHPVLTEQGWVPGGLLREGDTVFRGMPGHRVVDCRPEVDQRPALIEDVFHAARVAFPLVRVPLATEDFHADAAEGEVEIVYTDGHLPTEWNPHADQVVSEFGLVAAHGRREALDGGGALGALIPSGAPPSRGSVRGSGLQLPLLGGHLRGPELPGGTPGPRFDAPPEKFSLENSAVYAERGLNLKRRLAGLVKGDRIVELRRIGWSGHVYNLQTREGWYQSNNHIVSNCDCDVKPIRDSDPPLVLDEKLLAQTHEQVAAFANIENANAEEYQNLIVTHEHGEIGPVMGWRHQNFRSAADI